MERFEKLYLVRNVSMEFSRQYFCYKEYLKLYENQKPQDLLPILLLNNFFDIALLNWAHLFGNREDALHFKKVLNNSDPFKRDIKSGNRGQTTVLTE